GRHALQRVHQRRHRNLRRVLHQQVDVIVLAIHLDQACFEVGAHLGEHPTQEVEVLPCQHSTPILGHEDQVNMECGKTVSTASVVLDLAHSPNARMIACSSGTTSASTRPPVSAKRWRRRSGARGWCTTTGCASGRKPTPPGCPTARPPSCSAGCSPRRGSRPSGRGSLRCPMSCWCSR